jgi:hypothetical protein
MTSIEADLGGDPEMIKDSVNGTTRPVPRDEHRLELALRARSRALGSRTGSVGRCPSCGRPIARSEAWLGVGSLVVHPDCLYG